MPFLCLARADIPAGTLQVTDLWPNKSQYNVPYGPAPQGPRYLRQPQTATVVLASTTTDEYHFARAASGLAAYLIANVASGAASIALTPTQADTVAAHIITRLRAGNSVTEANVNTLLAADVHSGTTLAGGDSTGTITDILRILAGATYTVPSGTQIQTDTGPAFTPQADPTTWNANNFDFTTYKDVLTMDSSFYISLAEGQISKYTLPTFSYKGITGAALVAYDDSGAVL